MEVSCADGKTGNGRSGSQHRKRLKKWKNGSLSSPERHRNPIFLLPHPPLYFARMLVVFVLPVPPKS